MARICLLLLCLKMCEIYSQEGRWETSWTKNDSDVVSDLLDQWKRNASDALDEDWKQRLPKGIIIGVRKGGTRALLEMLSLHPQIAAAHSEIHFFNVEENYQKGLDWYCEQMPNSHSAQITVEKTPGYFSSLEAPERIYAMDRSVKLLLIVRDPVERLVSDYTQILYNRKARQKPYQSLEEILKRGQELNTNYKAMQRSLYALHLARWLEFFPTTQIHVVDGGGLIRQPDSEMRHVEQFLGLEPYLGPDNFYFNETKGFFCLQAKGERHCLDQSKGRPHPTVDELLLERLCTYFSQHNEDFFAMVGRTFNWC
ncbi:heparan sulfate glucosamine 3-O-sulfotransferase 1-like [Protobothrops mucrosquamatus]|uniref:heparan sulfate glucosamine 3-O-sulfotransferase 1-like n=1 Tax=Protobothrops mucrosquamatus TaxID=103944 RepID=UPI000775DB1D|nr:heparan sulfate glucosamine 3-O-sulfotransferase 1-like [Protobothrops mucrosquamatus]